MTPMMHAPLILDVAGLELTAADRKRLRNPLVGGVVLFARNWQRREQLAALCAQIKALRPDLLIAVDHEGGRVQRFRTDGFTPLPAMRELGTNWMVDAPGSMRRAAACGFVLATELRACGVDFSFTPVLDLDWGGSTVIGDRAFHADARVVTVLAQSLMLGMARAGMAHCAKHFPGHGFVRADTHLDVARDPRSLDAIWAADAAPYQWLAPGLRAVMPAHVIYPEVDAQPAGFSKVWLQEVLRERIGFTGAILSDDLGMAAARANGQSLSQAALAGLEAGCDAMLVCNQSVIEGGRPLDDLLRELGQAMRQGRWTPDARSAQRRLDLLPTQPALPWDELMVSDTYLAALDAMHGTEAQG
ncbi:beta-N-acetylhexosaminidase [Thiomonas bhubaneswarensis]|uniref:Beta-hexosaminidase n=1 Tax=Thiomonas bhubaneswarensis TaxID=339866 RepID=A0A0K6I364_9BURK|nr:beta-N-acetylhexosaminidase [Thiomonas bhubaneswarensis]CUA97732.1 Glycosyl hydrolase family 3 N terminal domain [Thiomonas bhubaneswarensis]